MKASHLIIGLVICTAIGAWIGSINASKFQEVMENSSPYMLTIKGVDATPSDIVE